MTNNLAIKILTGDVLGTSEQTHEAIKMAVKALSLERKGRWISRDGKDDCFECSECHAVLEGDEVYWRNNYFCYHCGADMRGEQDD